MSAGYWGDQVPEETLSREEAAHVMRRLFRMLRPDTRSIVLAVFVLMAQAAALLAGPALVAYGIDQGIRKNDAAALNRAVIVYLAMALLGYVLGRAAIVLVARIGEGFLRRMRNRLFGHLMSLSLDYFETEKTGKIIARMTSDIDAMQELISQGLVLFVQNIFLFTGAVVVILVLSWQLALGVLVIVPPVFFTSRWFRRVSNQAYLDVRDSISTNLSTLQEGLEGVRVVQAFGREGSFTRRFWRTNEDQYLANMVTVRISSRYFPFIEYAGVAATAVIVGYGGWLASRGVVEVGVVAAFVLYLQNVFDPINQLSQLYNTVQSAGAAMHKIFGVLDTQASIKERPGAVDLQRDGGIQVDHVTFAYGHNAPVLHDVSLEIMPGERVAFVGPTGAGKSTLAKLVARFYDPTEGAVRVGGVDLHDATMQSLRDRIVVVPQEGFLFAGTLRDNVRIGRPGASDEDVDRALEALGLLERFRAFPGGLGMEVHEHRIPAVGRGASAHLARPRRARRSRGARARRGDLEPRPRHRAPCRTGDGTPHAGSHRDRRRAPSLHGRAPADRIAVVLDGKLAELGTHAELIAHGGHYAELYRTWSAHQAQPQVPDVA